MYICVHVRKDMGISIRTYIHIIYTYACIGLYRIDICVEMFGCFAQDERQRGQDSGFDIRRDAVTHDTNERTGNLDDQRSKSGLGRKVNHFTQTLPNQTSTTTTAKHNNSNL